MATTDRRRWGSKTAIFRALIDSVVLYPCDAVSTERLTEAAARAHGIVYIHTVLPKNETPVKP